MTAGDPNQPLIDAINDSAQQEQQIAEQQHQDQQAQIAALADLKASIDQQNAIANSTVGIQLREATRALGDMLSGELGQRVNAKSMMPGTGALSRF